MQNTSHIALNSISSFFPSEIERLYCETACCDLRSLRNSGNSHRVPKLPVVLFLPARKMSMERVGQSGLKNL